MICVYHDDFDGFCSAVIIRKAYPECVFERVNYGMEIPDFSGHETIFMVDFCLPFDVMTKLNDEHTLIYIDHHSPKIDEANNLGFNPQGLRRVGIGACVLTYEYLFPGEECPKSVRLIGRYDVWDTDEEVISFNRGLSSLPGVCSIDGWVWNNILCESFNVDEVLARGRIVSNYVDNENYKYAKSYAYPAILHGPFGRTYNAIVLNLGKAGSLAFNSVWDDVEYDVMVSCVQRVDKWFISLYTTRDDVDCAEIARFYGGNGHVQAAGMCVKDLGIVVELIKRECE
jgi:oligoribonuclease NrnB/cAMP/cGMP phosphodiesterase (DHH superfamily)